MADISPHAVVEDGAQLAADVRVGPFSTIGPNVRIGPGCVIHDHVCITGHTTIGPNNIFFPFAAIGCAPQDLKYAGGKVELVIGEENLFREQVTVNCGTEHGGGITTIGNKSLFMIGTHIAHDCVIEDEIVIGNYTQLAGHSKIEKCAWLSGFTGTHHFTTIGRYAYTAGMAGLNRDVPPFVMVQGSYPFSVRGLNDRGLRRRGFTDEQIEALHLAVRKIFYAKTDKMSILKDLAATDGLDENVRYLVDSLLRSAEHRHGRYRELARDH